MEEFLGYAKYERGEKIIIETVISKKHLKLHLER